MVLLFLTSRFYTFRGSFIAMMLHGNLKNKMQFKIKSQKFVVFMLHCYKATNKNEEKYKR